MAAKFVLIPRENLRTRNVVLSCSKQAMVHVVDVQERTVRRLSLDVWPGVRPFSTVLHRESGALVDNAINSFRVANVCDNRRFGEQSSAKGLLLQSRALKSVTGQTARATKKKSELWPVRGWRHACLISKSRSQRPRPTSSFFEILPVMFRTIPCTISSDLSRTIEFSH